MKKLFYVWWFEVCLTTANFPAFFKIAFIRKISPVTWMNLESYITEMVLRKWAEDRSNQRFIIISSNK